MNAPSSDGNLDPNRQWEADVEKRASERRVTEVYYRGFAYNVASQFGVDSLKRAIRRDGNE